MQSGEVTVQVSRGTYTDRVITFGSSYRSTPYVIVQNTSSSTAWQYGLITHTVINVTTTGFTLHILNGNTGNDLSPAFRWFAFLP